MRSSPVKNKFSRLRCEELFGKRGTLENRRRDRHQDCSINSCRSETRQEFRRPEVPKVLTTFATVKADIYHRTVLNEPSLLYYRCPCFTTEALARLFSMTKHEAINYVEFPSRDLTATKLFFENCFGWRFTEYGPDYRAFDGAGLDGGCFKSDVVARTANGSTLVVLYSERLEETLAKVESAGGEILQPIFSFPGGKRFHFAEPGGSEFAVWSALD